MGKWLTRLLFDWVFVLLYRLFQSFLNLVDFIESFFDVFAGTAKVFYKGNADFLINIFFGHDAVTNAFWAMALIAIVLTVGFCILQMARKAADVTGAVKQSVGQIMSNFFRALLIILLLNAGTVAAINITNVLLDRINYALENAANLDQEAKDKTFTEQEFATMTKILATVANYASNPSADSRYNVNSCFNAVRTDLLSLQVNGFFQYDYPMDSNGHYTWQGALALLAASADLTVDLNLDTYYSDVTFAFQTVSREISTYREFAPVRSAQSIVVDSMDTDVLIFLITGMEASQNAMYNTGNFTDAIRKGYVSGEKDYNNLTQVRKDFDIWKIDYLVGYITCIVFVIIMTICIFTFIVRMFNLMLLYITAPLFVSSMPLDEGNKWQNWTQAFVIQLFSGFGMIIAMRLYLIIIPIMISGDLVFFAGSGLGMAILNRMAQLLMVLGGAWAVLQAGSVITGILAGNPGMAAIQQEGRIGGMVTGWAMRAPRAALHTAGRLVTAPSHAANRVESSRVRKLERGSHKEELAARDAFKRRKAAEALQVKADHAAAEGGKHSAARLQRKADAAFKGASAAQAKLDKTRAKYGIRPPGDAASGGGEGGPGGGGPGKGAGGGLGGPGGPKGPGGSPAGSGAAKPVMTPPPARPARGNPYSPEMYDTSRLGGGSSAAKGAGASVSGGAPGDGKGVPPRSGAQARSASGAAGSAAGPGGSPRAPGGGKGVPPRSGVQAHPASGTAGSAAGSGGAPGASGGGKGVPPRPGAQARSASGETGSAAAASGGAPKAPGPPAGKRWTPPAGSSDAGGGSSVKMPGAVPLSEQIVDASLPRRQPGVPAASPAPAPARHRAHMTGFKRQAEGRKTSAGRGGGPAGTSRTGSSSRRGGHVPGAGDTARTQRASGARGDASAPPASSGGGKGVPPRSGTGARSASGETGSAAGSGGSPGASGGPGSATTGASRMTPPARHRAHGASSPKSFRARRPSAGAEGAPAGAPRTASSPRQAAHASGATDIPRARGAYGGSAGASTGAPQTASSPRQAGHTSGPAGTPRARGTYEGSGSASTGAPQAAPSPRQAGHTPGPADTPRARGTYEGSGSASTGAPQAASSPRQAGHTPGPADTPRARGTYEGSGSASTGAPQAASSPRQAGHTPGPADTPRARGTYEGSGSASTGAPQAVPLSEMLVDASVPLDSPRGRPASPGTGGAPRSGMRAGASAPMDASGGKAPGSPPRNRHVPKPRHRKRRKDS